MKAQQLRSIKKARKFLFSQKERQNVIDRVYGIWKNKHPDPIKELAKMRKEWG